jgi:hypothetical protein
MRSSVRVVRPGGTVQDGKESRTSSSLEAFVFHTKSRTEQMQETLQESTASLAGSAANVTDQLRERVVPAVGHTVGHVTGSAREWSQPRVEAARGWAKPRLEHGIEVAAPRLESAVSGLAPKVDTARDKIVEDLLPRLTESIAAFAAATTAAKEEAVSRGTGAASVISGNAVATPKHKRRRQVLLVLGVLGAVAAGVAAFMRKSAPKDDPWATPLADPYVAPASSRQSDTASGWASPDVAASVDGAALDGTDAPGPQDAVADADLAGSDKDDSSHP